MFLVQLLDKDKLNPRSRTEMDTALKKLTGYIEGLRFHMQGVQRKLKTKMGSHTLGLPGSPPRGADSHYRLSRSQRQVIARWERMTEKVFLLGGKINQASFFPAVYLP